MSQKKAPGRAAEKIPLKDAVAPAVKAAKAKSAAGFPIVGLGASAGGLEAFEQFLRQLPAVSGMAFVLVQHLDPTHASILTTILQRSTAMPVLEAQDQMVVEPNHVYVIPPNREMAIFHGVLHLMMPEEPRGLRMPIDGFLRSLAEDQGERAIGIILSGTGTDGTLGLRAIVGAGGISLAQEPSDAKYDGMPTSAIKAGFVTHVLPAEKIPQALITGVRSLVLQPATPPGPAAGAVNRILMLMRTATGHDFSRYKKSTIGRRIERRMSQHNIEDAEIYARYLKEHPAEIKVLFKELLINVTSFFRDPEAFAVLKADILPQLLEGKPESYTFRVWVAGCATGEEAYSVAMLLRELLDEVRIEYKVQIYGTDLDEDAIAFARAGLYPPNIAPDVSPERLRRFFIKEDTGYRVKKELRDMVVFAVQSVIKDPPFTRLDLLCCRNLMIYMEADLQDRLIPTFHYALRPGGVLFLSPSEGVGNHTRLFEPISRKWKLYRAIPSVASTRAVLASGLSWAAEIGGKPAEPLPVRAIDTSLADISRRMLLQTFAPASVVTDLQGNIRYVHGETGRHLRPAPGQATLNVVDMAREGLQIELREALRNAASHGTPTLGREVVVRNNGDSHTVSLSVRPLPGPDAANSLLLISFQDVAPAAAPPKRGRARQASATTEARRVEELERDLAYTRENLQASLEEQQASNEELKSSNEELQSTNEELQSTNEELETSKEELQSLNEELATVNVELETKIEQMFRMQNDMKNLLDNMRVATLFLDSHLLIRRFTRDAVKVYRLIDSDVGRPLADIKSELQNEELLVDARAVLDSLVPCEREVRANDGTWYLMRIQPYRTVDNVIDGVVITFTDITERLAAIAERKARELAESIVDTVREPLVVLDGGLRVISASRSFCAAFQVGREQALGKPIFALNNRQWDIPALHEFLETTLPRDGNLDNYAVEVDFPPIGHRRLLLNARRIAGLAGNAELVLLTIGDVTGARE